MARRVSSKHGHQAIAQYRAKEGRIFVDIGEPACMACNGWWADKWQGSGLHRHHIRPLATGGRDELANLVLLCQECHRECPHDKNGKLFWSWLRVRPAMRWSALKVKLDCMLDAYGIGQGVGGELFSVWIGKGMPDVSGSPPNPNQNSALVLLTSFCLWAIEETKHDRNLRQLSFFDAVTVQPALYGG